jgi:hypothetical protein
MIPVAIFLRRRPEDMGLLPDGVDPEEAERSEDDADAYAAPQRQQETYMTAKQALNTRPFTCS